VDRDKRFMDPVLFRSIASAVVPLTEEVCFHLMGEPLLHPNLDEYLQYCQSIGLRVNLTTNGILLNAQRADALLGPALSQINFSLQSFESNFPYQDDSAYLSRLFSFTERALRERPDLYINYRLWNDGVPGAIDSNARMIEKICRGLQVDRIGPTDVRGRKSTRIKGRVYLHRDSRFIWPHPSQPVRSQQGFCYGLSSHIGILADGTVVPCCLDKEGIISLGRCQTQPISDIIDSPRAQTIREGFQRRNLVEDLCQRCTFIARFDQKARSFATPASV
jgi:MoaA/NifB/PqqE/SkfB family radical SAM enzyme